MVVVVVVVGVVVENGIWPWWHKGMASSRQFLSDHRKWSWRLRLAQSRRFWPNAGEPWAQEEAARSVEECCHIHLRITFCGLSFHESLHKT